MSLVSLFSDRYALIQVLKRLIDGSYGAWRSCLALLCTCQQAAALASDDSFFEAILSVVWPALPSKKELAEFIERESGKNPGSIKSTLSFVFQHSFLQFGPGKALGCRLAFTLHYPFILPLAAFSKEEEVNDISVASGQLKAQIIYITELDASTAFSLLGLLLRSNSQCEFLMLSDISLSNEQDQAKLNGALFAFIHSQRDLDSLSLTGSKRASESQIFEPDRDLQLAFCSENNLKFSQPLATENQVNVLLNALFPEQPSRRSFSVPVLSLRFHDLDALWLFCSGLRERLESNDLVKALFDDERDASDFTLAQLKALQEKADKSLKTTAVKVDIEVTGSEDIEESDMLEIDSAMCALLTSGIAREQLVLRPFCIRSLSQAKALGKAIVMTSASSLEWYGVHSDDEAYERVIEQATRDHEALQGKPFDSIIRSLDDCSY